MPSTSTDLRFTGSYSLYSSATMAAGASFAPEPRVTDAEAPPSLDIAFAVDGSWETVGARLIQDESGVHATIRGPGAISAERVRDQLEQIFSLDRDGEAFGELGNEDPVVGDLQHRFEGVRPVLYPSPYEAAARAIVMHRISRRQAAIVMERISEEHGEEVDFGDHVVHAFPAPEKLADLTFVGGLAARKVEQLAALGAAAGDGRFTRDTLRRMDRAEAAVHLRQLPGIGPFSADLIMIRGAGDPDVFPTTEKSLHRAMAAAYDLGDDPDLATLEAIAGGWSPFRSWVGLLFRHLIE